MPDDQQLDKDHETIVIQPPRPVHRFGIGLNVLLQILLVLVIFGVVNYLGARHYHRWDATFDRDYTLSEPTKQLLNHLDHDAELVVAFTRTSPIAKDIAILAEEYAKESGGKLTTRFIDPVLDPSAAEELKLQRKINLERNGVVIINGDKTKFVSEEEMVYQDPSRMGERSLVEFRGEDALTSALISVSGDGVKKLYVVTGKGAMRSTQFGTATKTLEDFAARQNASILPINLGEVEEVPADAAAIILVGVQYDLTDREAEILRVYWEGRNGALLALLNPESDTPKLDTFLAGYGLSPQNDRVLYAESTGAGARKEFGVQANFVPGNRATQGLLGSSTSFAGQTRSIALEKDTDALLQRRIEVRPLLEATIRYWGETSFLQKLPTLDENDNKPPIFVAASAELGVVSDEQLRIDSSRLVVIGNATLIDPDVIAPANYDLISSSLNWMLDREELIGIPPKMKRFFRLDITQQQHQNIFLLIAITLPASMLGLGFIVWTLRRS